MLSALLTDYKAVDSSAARGFVEAYLGEYYYPRTFDLSDCFPNDSTLSNAMDYAIRSEVDSLWNFLTFWRVIDSSIIEDIQSCSYEVQQKFKTINMQKNLTYERWDAE